MARRYTDEERALCRAVYEARGAKEAAGECGIKLNTVRGWVSRYGWRVSTNRRDELRENAGNAAIEWNARRTALANELGGAAERTLQVITNALEAGTVTTDQAIRAIAVLIDKAQLLSGGATTRPDLDGAKLLGNITELGRLLAPKGNP